MNNCYSVLHVLILLGKVVLHYQNFNLRFNSSREHFDMTINMKDLLHNPKPLRALAPPLHHISTTLSYTGSTLPTSHSANRATRPLHSGSSMKPCSISLAPLTRLLSSISFILALLACCVLSTHSHDPC